MSAGLFIAASREGRPSAPTQWQCMCDLLLRWLPSVDSQPSALLHHSYEASERGVLNVNGQLLPTP